MKLTRSSYYYASKEKTLWEQKRQADLQDRIEQLVCEFHGYGYRRVTKQLQREGCKINHKKVLRIMRESSLLCAVKRSYKRTTNSQHPYPRYPNLIKDRVVSGINKVWVADITYSAPGLRKAVGDSETEQEHVWNTSYWNKEVLKKDDSPLLRGGKSRSEGDLLHAGRVT